MLEHILRTQAQLLHEQFDDHDTDDFMRRLAARIAQESARAERAADNGGTPTPAPPSPPRPPAPPPPGQDIHRTPAPPRTPARRTPRHHCPLVIVTDQSTGPATVFRHIRSLCEAVLQSEDIDTLNAFAEDYDQAGARTFACLLYLTNRRESALYWWRFAAGGGDPLAAHLLASYHAAGGCGPDARLWRAYARMLGFTSRHLPRPIREQTDIADHFARTAPGNSQQRQFMKSDHLARELIAH